MSKDKYKVRNWSKYSQGLKQRGSITVWVTADLIEQWKYQGERKRGGQPQYSDTAIVLCLTVRKVYHLGLRQTQGFMENLFRLMKLDVAVPDFSIMSRRGKALSVDLSAVSGKGVTDVAVDSTGLKVYGEGEWKVRKHGAGKHRTWMKLHIAIDETTQQIEAVTLTSNSVDDASEVNNLLCQITKPVKTFKGDGAYDKKKVRKTLYQRKIEQIIPPQHNAVISDGALDFWQQRDKTIKAIAETSRTKWKQQSGYHQRSKAETTMFRYKTILGSSLAARNKENQITEVKIGCRILNIALQIAKPESYKIA